MTSLISSNTSQRTTNLTSFSKPKNGKHQYSRRGMAPNKTNRLLTNKISNKSNTQTLKLNSYNNMLKKNNTFKYNNVYNYLHINNQINKNKNKINNNISPQIISKINNTASKSSVYKVKGKAIFENENFIIKKTFLTKGNANKAKNECLIYKYIRYLVKYNICPFIYYGFQCIYKEDNTIQLLVLNTNKKNINLYKLEKFITTHKKIFHESGDNYYFYIILFQIIYTLKCFDLVGIKHNDLHFGNIFIEENENYSRNTYNTYYIDNKQYNIPNIKYTVKIYDFDFASKFNRDTLNKKKGKEFKDEFKDEKMKEFNPIDFEIFYKNTFLNNEDSINFDLLKIIYTFYLYTNLNKYVNDIAILLSNFFAIQNPFGNLKVYDNKDIKQNKTQNRKNIESSFNIDKYKNFRYSNFSSIKNSTDIIDLVYEQIQVYKMTDFILKQTYNTNNLYKTN